MPASAGRALSFDLDWRTTVATLLLLPLLVGLGFWQLQRADEKALLAAAWEQRQSQPPVPLVQLWGEAVETLGYLPVSLAGVFVEDKYFLLDNRVMDGRFGFEVIGILELDDGAGVVLVNRGWIAADPARRELPEVPLVAGRVDLSGHVYVAPGTPYLLAEQELGGGWPKLLQAIEMNKLVPLVQATSGNRAFPYPVRIAARQPGALTVDWQVVNVSPDKHRAYAAQWFTLALALLVLFLLRSSNLWQLLRPWGNDQR